MPSVDAETIRLPSDVAARPVIGPLCAQITFTLSPISKSHIVRDPSDAADTASMLPAMVGTTATWLTLT